MYNLLTETIEILKENGKNMNDVLWVGSKDGKYKIDAEKFSKILNINYQTKHNYVEIADDLVIVGDGWWLERHNYDDINEWWEFKSIPVLQNNFKDFEKVKSDNSEYIGDRSIHIFNVKGGKE